MDYVEAARAIGARPARIMLRTILPNIAGPVLVQFSLAAASAVVLESGLSFLGLGVVPPAPSWGLMIGAARATMAQAPLLLLWPCLALSADHPGDERLVRCAARLGGGGAVAKRPSGCTGLLRDVSNQHHGERPPPPPPRAAAAPQPHQRPSWCMGSLRDFSDCPHGRAVPPHHGPGFAAAPGCLHR